ncbi:hypothetical protein [Arthrobacter sp. H35-D1]|uniref:hypothetical protein n=1 Tax=Arthrobacter sp. H35-D1 TaxID=3046202 RepID=UPI0024BA0BF6|nr:hypothetical protein [Arthrobacter sp. H35-D1]MDJ0315460.1 hypothetical protein [Arthrobacter sp. H35-D1]
MQLRPWWGTATGSGLFRGRLAYSRDAEDVVNRRFAAATLADLKAATPGTIAAGFGVAVVTLWRWRLQLAAAGVAGLIPESMGPKGSSRVSAEGKDRIVSVRASGLSLRAVGTAVGVSEFSVPGALKVADEQGAREAKTPSPALSATPDSAESNSEPLLPECRCYRPR